MTTAEVEVIFGFEGVIRPGVALAWEADNGAFATCWFHDNRIYAATWNDSEETIFDKLRRWQNGPRPKRIQAAD